MKKIIAMILSICIIFTNCTGIFANGKEKELELIGVLEHVDKVKLVQNNDNFGEAYAVDENLKTSIKWNKKTNEVNFKVENLKTRSLLEESTFNIDINDNFEAIGMIEYDGEKYDLSEIDVNNNGRMAVTLPVILGSALVSALIAASLTVVIAGTTYYLVTKVAATLRKNKEHKHYQAAIRYNSSLGRNDLFIGNPLKLGGAAGRLKNGATGQKDVWSTSPSAAFQVAETAGGGKLPVHDDPHGGIGYYAHYHTFNRKGGHSFY